MPELAEVEYFRKRWNPGLGASIVAVHLRAGSRVFAGSDAARLTAALTGAKLTHSEAAAKQMLFRSNREGWLGIHLGMTGELRAEPANYEPKKADQLVLAQAKRTLVFSDFRMFGRIRFDEGATAPAWWADIAPAILSSGFTAERLAAFLRRRAGSPIKAVLLMQEQFPGVGNWMADEILWRAALHPKRRAGSLDAKEVGALHRECQWVCRHALETIGETFADPPASWLFPHRWEDGGRCPRTGGALQRETVGGRTTCWSPRRQRLSPKEQP